MDHSAGIALEADIAPQLPTFHLGNDDLWHSLCLHDCYYLLFSHRFLWRHFPAFSVYSVGHALRVDPLPNHSHNHGKEDVNYVLLW
eukprot:c44835_g1_i1 orf=171-428(-)